MIRLISCSLALAVLAGCSSKQSDVKITTNRPSAGVQTASRSEPVFYNGKTYKLDYNYEAGSDTFAAQVTGMRANQQTEAEGMVTSAVGHFACPSARSRLAGTPHYASGKWHVPARCT